MQNCYAFLFFKVIVNKSFQGKFAVIVDDVIVAAPSAVTAATAGAAVAAVKGVTAVETVMGVTAFVSVAEVVFAAVLGVVIVCYESAIKLKQQKDSTQVGSSIAHKNQTWLLTPCHEHSSFILE